MNTLIKVFGCAVLFFSATQSGLAQRASVKLQESVCKGFKQDAQEYLASANRELIELNSLNTTSEQSNREKKHLATILHESIRVANQVLSAPDQFTQSEYDAFQRQLQTLGGKLDQASQGSQQCRQECDAAYPGWGQGKGFNRLLCKAACIKIQIGRNGAG